MSLAPGMNRPSHNLDGVLSAIGPRTRLVYLVSPSNPEGLVLDESDFAAFIEKVPANVPVLIDEAYVEFADDPELVRTSVWSQREDHIVIGLRTFSKFHGLAGLRVGYSFARPDIARLLAKQSFIFSVNHLGEEAAIAALGDTEHRSRVFRTVRDERLRISKRASELGLQVISSHAPFMMIEAPCPLPRYKTVFSEAGLFVPFYEFYDGNFVMFPIGNADQNTRTLEMLETLV
jgi:histidinol-phosphate aminotransferase